MTKLIIAIGLLLFLQAAFFATTAYLKPTTWFGAFYLTWVLIPATVAALAFMPRLHFVAAILNAVLAALMWDYLFLQHGYFWPGRPKETPSLAIGYVVIAAGLAFVVAGYVHVIVTAINAAPATSMLQRVVGATRKGIGFSALCALVAVAVLTFATPSLGGREPAPNLVYQFAILATVAFSLTSIGALMAVAIALMYIPAKYSDRPNSG